MQFPFPSLPYILDVEPNVDDGDAGNRAFIFAHVSPVRFDIQLTMLYTASASPWL